MSWNKATVHGTRELLKHKSTVDLCIMKSKLMFVKSLIDWELIERRKK